MTRLRPLLACAILIAATGIARADMPDLLLPEGAVQTLSDQTDPGSYDLPTGKFTPNSKPTKGLEGRISRAIYRMPSDMSPSLALAQELRDQLDRLGYRLIFECETESCGGFDFRFGTDVTPPPEMEFSLSDFRQLSAQRPEDDSHISMLISTTRRATYLQITLVEPGSGGVGPLALVKPADKAEISSARTLGEQLDRDGHAVLDGVAFTSGSTELDEAARAALLEIASLMAERPDLRILIVGHTDTEGALEGNINISRARARAVAAVLIEDHGILPERIEAEGAGFLAPRATNATEEGRALNRRVEIVLR